MKISCPKCESTIQETDLDCPYCNTAISRVTNSDGVLGRWYQRVFGLRRQKQLRANEQMLSRRGISKVGPVLSPSYKAYPFPPEFSDIDHEKFHHSLLTRSFSPECFDAFTDPREGYGLNKKWIRGWVENRPGLHLAALYLANHFGDQEMFSQFRESGMKRIPEGAGDLFRLHFRPGMEDPDKSFFERYIPLDKASVQRYGRDMKWMPLIESGDVERIQFYQDLGIEVKIGDEGLTTVGHTDFTRFYTYDYTSPIAEALKTNDLNRLAFLLKWGANTNQYLHSSCSRTAGAKAVYSEPVMFKIGSVEAFRMMTDAGMEWYPCPNPDRSEDRGNLIENLWLGEHIEGGRLRLLEYLYEIGYDKPLRGKKEYFRDVIDNNDGGSYERNVDHIRQWLRKLG